MGILKDIIEMSKSSTYNENQFRIRTKRRRKRASIEAKDKKLIGLYKQDKELRKQKKELPMIDLVPPIQKGYKRFFVVREDVKRSKIRSFYENLLQKINTFQYNETKIFKQKTKKFGRKIYVEREQSLKVFYPNDFAKLKLNERQIECFELRLLQEIRGRTIYSKEVYVFKEPWRFVLRIRPNMIEKVKLFDAELEQKIAEVDAVIYNNYKNHGRLKKLRDWGRYHNYNEEKHKNPLKNMPLHLIMEDFK